jgi:CheY-like chemotaxis protein
MLAMSAYHIQIQLNLEFKPDYYDLILLDIKMPVLDGFELCEKIREVDKIAYIVFITASEAYYKKFRNQYYPK